MEAHKTKEAYADFLQTKFWKELRIECFTRDKFTCLRCGKSGHSSCLNAHHRVYRDRWEQTELEDLETLCLRCHKAEHGIEVGPKWGEKRPDPLDTNDLTKSATVVQTGRVDDRGLPIIQVQTFNRLLPGEASKRASLKRKGRQRQFR